MYLNNYSVRVIGGQERESGYVEIGHGKVYALQLRNDHNVRCDAQVVIDGKEIGTFRIAAHDSLSLQRSPQDSGRFTFYAEGTPEAAQAQIVQRNPNNGLIAVTFMPELVQEIKPLAGQVVYRQPFNPNEGWASPNTTNVNNVVLATNSGGAVARTENLSYRSGATGLSGYSNQGFIDVPAIEYDYAGRTTINLRLVSVEQNNIRPLIGQSNPVPPYRA